MRTGKVTNSSQFSNVGGVGEIVEKINWDSSVSWSYQLANDDECLHHDVEILPNGNILMIVWDHVIQDYSASKNNYGVVADHPERIDLNSQITSLS